MKIILYKIELIDFEPDVYDILLMAYPFIVANTTGYYDEAPLHHAETVEIAQVLLDYGADPNEMNDEQRTPLHRAKSAEIVRLLLENGAKPVEMDDRGCTPRYYTNDSEINELLIKYGHPK